MIGFLVEAAAAVFFGSVVAWAVFAWEIPGWKEERIHEEKDT